MEAADQHRQSSAAKFPRQVAGPWELIRLHTHQANNRFRQAPVLGAADLAHRNLVHGFVVQVDLHLPAVTEALLADHLFCQPREARQRVARQHPTPMADHITIVVILRRLDEI